MGSAQNAGCGVAKRSVISIVTPVFNEEENIGPLCAQIIKVMEEFGRSYELIAVDDGSSDRSLEVLTKIASDNKQVKIISFRKNSGQTAAIMAGLDFAQGEIIVLIDSDLQNDCRDIPLLVSKLDEGFDVVSGWRKDRKDATLQRNFPSYIANRLISYLSRVHLQDYGCTLKAYRRDVIKGVRLYGEMHRFIPIYATWMGGRVTEVPVRHHPRVSGRSKYGLERVAKVILDLLVVKFLDKNFNKPIYVFGGFGLVALFASFLSVGAALYLKLVDGLSLIRTPLPLFAAMNFLVGVLSILMGLVAEMVVRTYYESQGRSMYSVRKTINFDVS
jgi:glycosyltransferase involved in cell wall biosynthesis